MMDSLRTFLMDGPVSLLDTVRAMEGKTTVLIAMDRFKQFCDGLSSTGLNNASTDRKKVWFELRDALRNGLIAIIPTTGRGKFMTPPMVKWVGD